MTRDSDNPKNIELNDVLGNYSLTLIDSLSTLAILASAPPEDGGTGPRALASFQDGIAALVEQYGDGRPGRSGQGLRGRGFDVDSKVQVFETVIRGVGGLLSAHLFAVGELPIAGYQPPRSDDHANPQPISWPNGLTYDGQLLRLALDLAQRLLPAFYTDTGMPYPRVNLRHGIPFYTNSPIHGLHSARAVGMEGPAEITETCSAGAGSLVLEFTVLSRLTGDARFEQLAKRAFWAVWARRSNIGLIGAGVDAEAGHWVGALSVIGAGADSFFEYALKTHILLSGHELPNQTLARPEVNNQWLDPNTLYEPLSDEENSPDSFLQAWHHAHAAIKRHLYNEGGHPHYDTVNIWTGSLATQWIDSLGAYYSGLLTLAGELDEAIETNLLYTAIWTKYSALPERWSIKDKTVEGGLGWWPLRPEFIESTYHLYRATKDPWYLYVGEMVLRDITRRCWTECGWTGLQNVVDGEKSDRMESFFLGETAKYMYLLYDDRHPMNSLDAPYVFTTEGHPLIVPRRKHDREPRRKVAAGEEVALAYYDESFTNSCPAVPEPVPLTGSAIAARRDIYHAARMLDLHLIPNPHAGTKAGPKPGQFRMVSNHTHFPWTLPPQLLPDDGTCAKVYQPQEQHLEFTAPAQQTGVGSNLNYLMGGHGLSRISVDTIRVTTLAGLQLTLRLEEEGEGEWRVLKANGIPLGRDEHVAMSRSILGDISDTRFSLVRDSVTVKLHHLHVVDLASNETSGPSSSTQSASRDVEQPEVTHLSVQGGGGGVSESQPSATITASLGASVGVRSLISSWIRSVVSSLDRPPLATFLPALAHQHTSVNFVINATAVTPTGLGAAPPPALDIPPDAHIPNFGPIPEYLLPWASVYAGGYACDEPLPEEAVRRNHVIVLRRGGCSFSEKLANIPSYSPTSAALQLVIVVSDDDDDGGGVPSAEEQQGGIGGEGTGGYIRPLLDEVQRTPAGVARRHLVPMVMVGGGNEAYHQLAHADRVGMTQRYYVESHGVRVRNIVVDDGDAEAPTGLRV